VVASLRFHVSWVVEYVPAAYMRRKFLTGFGGSAGTAVVTQDEALLWTDSRYWNEASLQIDGSLWTLMKQGQSKVPTIVKYIAEQASKKYANEKTPLKVGIDPFVHPASFAKEFSEACSEAAKTELDLEDVAIGELVSNGNLIDPIWGEDRPEIPYNQFVSSQANCDFELLSSLESRLRYFAHFKARK
jgi:Xaa-Pro aminopeptidase